MTGELNKLALLQVLAGRFAFIPHGHCYLWKPELVWLHGLSDGIIALAYFAISIALIYFVRQRRDLPYPWVLQLFSAFIVACGLTHLLEIWTLWHPIYWVSGGLKAITAMISWITAAVFIPIIPQALTIPSRSELEAARLELEQQVRDRTQLLQQNEERWQLALRGNNDGIWDWNVQTNEVFFSSRWKQMLGFEDDEIAGCLEEWSRRVHPDDLAWVMQETQEHFAQKTPFYSAEYRIQCKDGSYKWILDRGQALWDESGRVIRMAGSHTDITDRKQAETELREMAEVLENAVAGISMLDIHGCYLYANKAYADITGYQPEELIGGDWRQTVHPENLERLMDAYEQMRQQGMVEIEAQGIRKDGTTFYKQLVMIATYDDQHQFVGHYCFMKDISERARLMAERLQAEQALAKELLRSNTLLSTSIDGIVVLNRQGNVVQSSASFAQMIGYALEETLQLSVFDWDAQWTGQELQQILEDDILPSLFETRHRRKDGSVYDVEISYSRVELDGERMHFCICRDISDRKQTEIALQNSQARFAGILEIASDAIISVNAEQQITLFNKGAERIFGYTFEEVVGQPLSLLLPDRLAQIHHHHISHYASTENRARQMAERGGIFGRRKNGTEFPAEASISKLVLDDEVIFTAFLRDITERRQAEEAIRRNEEKFRMAIDFTYNWEYWQAPDGSFVYVSPSCERITGYSPVAFIQNPGLINLIIHPDDRSRFSHHNCDDRLEAELMEFRILTRSGEIRWIAHICQPLFNPEGEYLGRRASNRDISERVRLEAERHQAEQALRESKEMFQAIVDHIPVMIALFDAQGMIEFINPKLEQVLGWSMTEWQQRNILEDCYPDPVERQRVLNHMLAATGQWKDSTTLNAKGQMLETSWANVQLSSGQFLGIGQDISDRKQKEIALRQAMEAAEAANLAKSMFLANMSHELRTPLNVILGFTQVMAHDPKLTPQQQEDLQTIRRSGDHLLNLINDILDLSKIEAGQTMLDAIGFDLIALLHTLRTMMTERSLAKRLKVELHIAPDVPQYIVADEQKLRQVLLNLLSNAIKFTKQGWVRLSVTVMNPAFTEALARNADAHQQRAGIAPPIMLQFAIRDTGVGIAAEERDIIFDAFVQAEAGRKSTGGTGLGLTISRKLLELMGGQIGVESVPGEGSTFTFSLPVVCVSGIEIPPDQREVRVIGLVPGQPHRRILVVDDQSENRQLLVRLLTQLGLEVREATNGQEAIQFWQSWHPDLILMDIRMPGLDGYEATRQIRALEQEPASVIMALTAQASQSDRTLALAAGCNDYISKPFREETLLLKLQEYLGLEYLYAEDGTPDILTMAALRADPIPSMQTLEQVTALPAIWFHSLEDAALCGNDRAIAELANQLPVECGTLSAYLIQLATQFQFEQILQWLHECFSGGSNDNVC